MVKKVFFLLKISVSYEDANFFFRRAWSPFTCQENEVTAKIRVFSISGSQYAVLILPCSSKFTKGSHLLSIHTQNVKWLC